MGKPDVGGDPTTIEAGASAMSAEQAKLPSIGSAISAACTSASAAVAVPGPQEALATFSTVWSRYVTDVATQLGAAAQLAQTGSADLAAAGGSGTGRSGGPR